MISADMDAMCLNVVVTQQDIDEGARRDSNTCPIALAVHRTLQDAGYNLHWQGSIQVTGLTISVTLANYRVYSAELPAAARTFVAAFDSGSWIPPVPFTFDVNLYLAGLGFTG